MKKILIFLLFFLLLISLSTQEALAFCGFYVAKADSSLYNQASQVIIARDGNRTVLTMANDYQGDVKDFALVVPVPVVLEKDQVHTGEAQILERLDSFSAPRLVEYFDTNPCAVYDAVPIPMPQSLEGGARGVEEQKRQKNSLGVTIERQFTVGEYDILILSAKQSDGLETWLRQSGEMTCSAAQEYKSQVRQRQEKEAQTLANLTGWDINRIREKIDFIDFKPVPWWRQLWQ